MATVMIFIAIGLFYSVIIFFLCEERSLKDSNLSDMKLLVKDEINVSEFFEEFNTIKYLSYYFMSVFLFTVGVSLYVYLPNKFGLLEVMAHTFIPSFMGSAAILLVKWRFQPIIKLISSFMFGSIYMAATAIAFAITYVIYG